MKHLNRNTNLCNPLKPLLVLCGVIPRCCSNCRYWRDKGWDGEGNGTGICDNPTVIDQVSMIGEEHLGLFVKGDTPEEIKYNARWIKNSLRFSDKFRCCHFNVV